ncbi:MAG: GAF domain-containing protein [Spirulinaceae cyanobacterium RM2_2_10]|nr:GAF domain-containing protein [Spirulinaceae cyanobacterium RM2_2_10]
MLRDVTARVGYMVGADRTTIFLLNDEKTELWSLVAESETGELLDIRVRVGDGIAGQVALNKQVIHIPDNVYDDLRSARVKEADQRFNYKTRNILAFPILNDDFEIVAVIQLLNKIQKDAGQPAGFSHQDLESLAKCVLPIRRILESCQNCYEGIRKAQATAALAEATRSLNQVNLSTDAILERVMGAAKKLLNADRSTLWLYDRQRGDLWTELSTQGKLRCEIGVGFAGQVAETREPKIVPFDLYDDPSAENAKKTDAQTRYRTCSLLCMPVLSPDGDLLGVTQLVNKRKPGNTEAYDPGMYPRVPEFFKTSFDKADRQAMQVFNERVGAILQFAQAHETLKQSAQVEPRDAVHQTLLLYGSVLSRVLANGAGRYTVLYTLLHLLTSALQQAIAAEHVHIFLVDSDRRQLWTLAADPHNQAVTELVMPADRGVAAKVLLDRQAKKSSKVAQIADDFVRIGLDAQQQEDLNSILLLPMLDEEQNYVAIAACSTRLPPKALATRMLKTSNGASCRCCRSCRPSSLSALS